MTSDVQTIDGITYTLSGSSPSIGAFCNVINPALSGPIYRWVTYSVSPPHTFQINFSKPITVSQVNFLGGNDNVDTLVKDYKIQYSVDGTNFIDVVQGTYPNYGAWNEKESANVFNNPVVCKAIRMVILSGYCTRGYVWGGLLNLKIFGSLTTNLYLFKDAKGKYFSIKTGSLVNIDNPTDNDSLFTLFKNQGSDVLPSTSQFNTLETPFSILAFSNSDAIGISTKVVANNGAKLILNKIDISLATIQCINSATVVSTSSGSGSIRFIVSKDHGETWLKFDGTEWVAIDVSNTENVILNGMTLSQINSISKAQWAVLNLTSAIRFGYALDINSSADVANTDMLKLNVDMKGTWMDCARGIDFNSGYSTSSTISVSLLSSGDFKINY